MSSAKTLLYSLKIAVKVLSAPFFLEGLEKGRKTSRELCDYLKPKVADAAARENRTQTPSCRGADVAF